MTTYHCDRAFGLDLRASTAPSFTPGLRLAEEGRFSQRQLLAAFWGASLISLPLVGCMWFPLTLAGLIKGVILRYGGPQVLRRVVPLFLGLAFGDGFMMALWIIVSLVTEGPGHSLLPG